MMPFRLGTCQTEKTLFLFIQPPRIIQSCIMSVNSKKQDFLETLKTKFSSVLPIETNMSIHRSFEAHQNPCPLSFNFSDNIFKRERASGIKQTATFQPFSITFISIICYIDLVSILEDKDIKSFL